MHFLIIDNIREQRNDFIYFLAELLILKRAIIPQIGQGISNTQLGNDLIFLHVNNLQISINAWSTDIVILKIIHICYGILVYLIIPNYRQGITYIHILKFSYAVMIYVDRLLYYFFNWP